MHTYAPRYVCKRVFEAYRIGHLCVLLLPHLMTCAVTPTRSDLVSMTTDAPLKAAAPEFARLCICANVHTFLSYYMVNIQ